MPCARLAAKTVRYTLPPAGLSPAIHIRVFFLTFTSPPWHGRELVDRGNDVIGQHSTSRAAAKGVSMVAVVPKPVHRGRGTTTLPVPGRSKSKFWLKGPVVLLQEAFDVGAVNAEVTADIRHLCRLRLECFFRHYAAAEDVRGRDDERIRDWPAA